ncbi:hypothetical protein K7H22_13620 [Seohaeicola saemankumensis]|uniref:hypothetical protein n=1 Tax=Seohaeicola saemankumensis TaxID=481181 RepID=UPI001E59DEF1|nr:hypothetical protein [Seohaeicola saemankumensis]MCD1627035.1 hypothetical protein [Seohaeicola saemankumensis]
MRFFFATAMVALLYGAVASAQSQSDHLENLTAVMAGEQICGFTVNQQILEIAVVSLFGDPASVSPGGKHWPEIQKNISRVQGLTATSSGRRSFCNTTKANLSAFFN